jgi:AcrR family transcriptional regulator
VSPKAGKNEEARERSRAALLQAGADLTVKTLSQNPFAALRLRKICEQAGYSTGAFYLHWSSLDEYYSDLTELLEAEDAFDADTAALTKLGESNAHADTLTAVAQVADRDLQLLVENPLYDAMELLNVTLGRTRFRERSAHAYRLFDHDIGQIYGPVLARRGREPRPPLDWDRIGVILQALIEGFTLRHKVDPASAPYSSESELSPYATAIASVLAVVTRPVGDDAGLSEALHALFEATASSGTVDRHQRNGQGASQ